MHKFYLQQNNFFPKAKGLRNIFDERFSDPRKTDSRRFVWDYWHVPGQYTFMRTPANHFFPSNIYSYFEKSLLMWGQKFLGCTGISPPWLSYYVDGCGQELHADVPHGPWAYVYSLTPWKSRKFSGGETMLLKPSLLNYWHNFNDTKDRELNSFMDFLPSPFNRLTVFDPRFPHGVSTVHGTKDPREARLVLHGWFIEPKPILIGALSAKKVAPILDNAVGSFQNQLAVYGKLHGTLSMRFFIQKNGSVENCKILANTVIATDFDQAALKFFVPKWKKILFSQRFPSAKSSTEVTLPLLFR